eukprot:4729856-Pyramimonas_sp.AAC.1
MDAAAPLTWPAGATFTCVLPQLDNAEVDLVSQSQGSHLHCWVRELRGEFGPLFFFFSHH